MTFKDIKKNYAKISPVDAEKHWRAEHQEGDVGCLHGKKCTVPGCDFGMRTQKVHCMTGDSLLDVMVRAIAAKKRRGIQARLDVVRICESASASASATATVAVKLPRSCHEELLDEILLEAENEGGAEDADYDIEG